MALDGAINVSQWREVAAVLALALVAVLLTEPMVASLRTRGM